MHGTEKLPDLIEEIYDAALEPALWNNVVVSIRLAGFSRRIRAANPD